MVTKAAELEYVRIEKGYLEVRVPLGKGRPSSTGKSLVLYSTGGFVQAEGGDRPVKVNLTAITKG